MRTYSDTELAELCAFVDRFLDDHRYAPDLGDICEFTGLGSKSAGWWIVNRAIERGWLAHLDRSPHTIHTTDLYRRENHAART